MTRSALPTGPCGSSTPSLHDASNIAAPVIEIARSHIADALGVLVTFRDIRSELAARITNSIGFHWRGWTYGWRGWTYGGILWKSHALPNPPNGGLSRSADRGKLLRVHRRATREERLHEYFAL